MRFSVAVVTKVQVHSDRIDVTLDQLGVALWLNAKDQRQSAHPGGDDREQHLTVLTIPARLKRTGIEMRMVVDDGSEPAKVDPVLVRLLVRAHAIRARLLRGAQPNVERDRRRGGDQQFLRYASLKARLPRPRHCHGDLKRKASSTAHRKPADGRYPPASRLDRTARTPLLLKRINSPVHARLRLASRSLAKNCGFGRETVVLPTHAIRDEPAQRRSIGAPKESLATEPNKICVQGPENARQFALRRDRKYLLYQ